MPADDDYRIAVDEASFDFRGMSGPELIDALDKFNDTLDALQSEQVVAAWLRWSEQHCLDGIPLYAFLYDGAQRDTQVSPDIRRRLARLMDKCRLWDDDEATETPDDVKVADVARSWPSTVGHALRRTRNGVTTACAALPASDAPTGWQPVTSDAGNGSVFFITDDPAITHFWRALFELEDVAEHEFFALATRAFPGLAFAVNLSFRRFIGSYRDLRPWVVQVLSATNDHFAASLSENAGLPRQVQAALGRHGLTLSPESPRTRANSAAMRLRDVEHNGETYRCEWHAKQQPTRNRVHFSLPDPRLDDKILVGIFVDHLPV